MGAIDDSALRAAALALLATARAQVPAVLMATHVMERHPRQFPLICEVIIDADGVRQTAIILDDGTDHQRVLAQRNGRARVPAAGAAR
jgi:hypothetical protein